MRIPKNSRYLRNLSEAQRFCVELWYSLTHQESLDSNRVRLHNGRTILVELHHELVLGLLFYRDLAALSKEAVRLCQEDHALSECLGDAQKTLMSALKEVSSPENQKSLRSLKGQDLVNEARVKKLRYILEDCLPAANRLYREKVFNGLYRALQNDSDPFSLVRRQVSTLLTDLIDGGWTLSSLYLWGRTLAGNFAKHKSFDERLEFLRGNILGAPQAYLIVLRISATKLIDKLGSFKGWTFQAAGVDFWQHLWETEGGMLANVPETTKQLPQELGNYVRTAERITFAWHRVESVDFSSAMYQALRSFGDCLDRLRYNFLNVKIRLPQKFLVIRLKDGKTRLEEASFPVPNPLLSLNVNDFRRNVRRLDELLAKGCVEENSRQRLAAAVRQYRIGRDAEGYQEKLLNWWIGLEYLGKLQSNTSVAGSVMPFVRDTMMVRYTLLLLLDIEPTLRKELRNWPEVVCNKLRCQRRTWLKPGQLLRVFQDEEMAEAVRAGLDGRPWLRVRFNELTGYFSSTDSLVEFLESHRQRVEWQLMRIYRVRCCLVHGTPLVLKLMLLSANAEFYLRETLFVIFQTMVRHDHVQSLKEYFDRLGFALQRRESLLREEKQKAPPEGALFDGLVLKTRPRTRRRERRQDGGLAIRNDGGKEEIGDLGEEKS